MTTVNIRRDVDDKFYRYKMPLLQTKIEGRGNGIKTVIPNMEDIARALARPPTYPTKFFGCELGAQTSFADDRYIVNGAHTADRLRELLDVFIDKFVLCPECKNPETEFVFSGSKKQEVIHRDCKACGAQTKLDMTHKLIAHILAKKPQTKTKGSSKSKKASGGKGMTAEANVGGPLVFEKSANGNGNGHANGNGNGNGHGDDGSEEDAPQSPEIAGAAVVPTSGTDIDAALGRADPILENPDASEEVSKKLRTLEVSTGGAEGDEDDEDADSPYSQLAAWLEENKGPELQDAQVIAKLKELEIVGKHKVLVEVGHHLFSDEVVKELPKRISLLQVLVTKGSEKHQKSLLGGLERLLALSPNADQLLASGTTAKLLMTLYQADILEEEVVRQWGTHVSKKYVDKEKSKKVRKSADAFIKWLDEAEDETESDEE